MSVFKINNLRDKGNLILAQHYQCLLCSRVNKKHRKYLLWQYQEQQVNNNAEINICNFFFFVNVLKYIKNNYYLRTCSQEIQHCLYKQLTMILFNLTSYWKCSHILSVEKVKIKLFLTRKSTFFMNIGNIIFTHFIYN